MRLMMEMANKALSMLNFKQYNNKLSTKRITMTSLSAQIFKKG